MNLLQYMRAFVCVAEAGSFTLAAEQMDSTTANVSRAVSNLESHLQTRLFNRTTRRIALTEAGQRYFVRCEAILASIDDAEAEVVATHQRPTGKLKVHAMSGIGTHYIIEAMAQYQALYPEVAFNLSLSNKVPDLVEEGFDMSIVLASELADSGYISMRLGTIYSVLCAAPKYLQRQGTPNTLEQLADHRCLIMTSMAYPDARWTFDGPAGQETVDVRDAPFQVNSIDAMCVAIVNGMGIGLLPSYSAIDALRAGNLERLLPDYRLQGLNLYAIYPSRHFQDAKIKTWLEHLRVFLPKAMADEERDLNAHGARQV